MDSVNPLWPSNTIWRRRSTLVQVTIGCLTTTSHYLNQCWFTTNEVPLRSFQGNVNLKTQDIYPWTVFQIYTFEITAHLPGDNGLIPMWDTYRLCVYPNTAVASGAVVVTVLRDVTTPPLPVEIIFVIFVVILKRWFRETVHVWRRGREESQSVQNMWFWYMSNNSTGSIR